MAVAVDPATLVLLTDAWLVGHLTDCNKQTNKFEKKRNPSIVVSTLGPFLLEAAVLLRRRLRISLRLRPIIERRRGRMTNEWKVDGN